MPITVAHIKSVTVTDGTNTDVVRPSDWNSTHAFTLSLNANEVIKSFIFGTMTITGGLLSFDPSGGVSFGVNTAGVVTGSVPAAAATNHTHGNIQFNLTNISASATSQSNGLTLAFSGPSPSGVGGPAISAQGGSQSTGTVSFANSNGVSFGLNAGTMTASHNALTTARASNDAIGLNTALTANGVAWTVNSSGLSMNFPAFLTTARASTDGIGLNTALTANGVSMTANSSGLSFNFPAFLTTAAASNHSHGNPQLNLTNLTGTTASNSAGFTLSLSAAAPGGGGGPAISAAGGSQSTGTVIFSNTAGISFGYNAGTITATHNALTTARASTDALGLNTALTANGVSMTANSSGLSLNFPAFLTTAANSTHSHGNPTLNLTNLSGTTNSNSGGFTLSLSAADAGGAVTHSSYMPPVCYGSSTGGAQIGASAIFVIPAPVEQYITASRFDHFISVSDSTSSNSSYAGAISFFAGIYTRNASTLSLASSASQSFQWTETSNNSMGSISGIRRLTCPLNVNMSPGDYWIAVMTKTGTTNANWFAASNVLCSWGLSQQMMGLIGEASNVTKQVVPGYGSVSFTSASMPTAIPISQITGHGSAGSVVHMAPMVQMFNYSA